MAAKPVEFLDEASAEYEATIDWYVSRSDSSASNFAQEIAQAIGRIAETPGRFPTSLHNTRKLLLHKFPFAVIYRERPSVIQILAIAHARRRPGYWKDRT